MLQALITEHGRTNEQPISYWLSSITRRPGVLNHRACATHEPSLGFVHARATPSLLQSSLCLRIETTVLFHGWP
jgi:hypothetical protein